MRLRRAESVTGRAALFSYLALLVLVLWWEAWAAPPTPVPRVFWLAVKLFPLLVPLSALWRGSARAYVLTALLVLLYFCEGVATAYSAARSGGATTLVYGALEIATTVSFVAAASYYARFRWRRENAQARAGTES